jgi:hypothetical protein
MYVHLEYHIESSRYCVFHAVLQGGWWRPVLWSRPSQHAQKRARVTLPLLLCAGWIVVEVRLWEACALEPDLHPPQQGAPATLPLLQCAGRYVLKGRGGL